MTRSRALKDLAEGRRQRGRPRCQQRRCSAALEKGQGVAIDQQGSHLAADLNAYLTKVLDDGSFILREKFSEVNVRRIHQQGTWTPVQEEEQGEPLMAPFEASKKGESDHILVSDAPRRRAKLDDEASVHSSQVGCLLGLVGWRRRLRGEVENTDFHGQGYSSASLKNFARY